jgi:coatomer subunit beta
MPESRNNLGQELTLNPRSPDMEVKRKALAVALEMTTSRNVEEVVLFLKKQLQATVDSNNETYDKSVEQEFRQLLIQSIHSCAIKFSEVAANVVHVLMDFLGDNNNPSAVDVIAFVRCVVETPRAVGRSD